MINYMEKLKHTTVLADEVFILNELYGEMEPFYESDGQFTGGVYTIAFLRDDNVYDFTVEGDTILNAVKYPKKYCKY